MQKHIPLQTESTTPTSPERDWETNYSIIYGNKTVVQHITNNFYLNIVFRPQIPMSYEIREKLKEVAKRKKLLRKVMHFKLKS